MIISTETGGLGNRIKSWVSAMRLDPDARVLWPLNRHMPARFDELFANDCGVDAIAPQARINHSWRLAILPEDEPHLPAGFATVGAGAHPLIRGLGKAWWEMTGRRSDRYRFMVFPKSHSRHSVRADARHIDLEYERIPPYFREVYVPLFGRILIRPQIMQRVDAFAAQNFDERIIGVQVRTWRDDPRRYRKYHKPSIKRLSRLLEAAGSEHRFFVVSDSDDVAPWLQDQVGSDRLLTYSRTTKRQGSWESVAGMTEDLIDLLLLARTNRLFASYLSTFSEAAWWLGGTRARVSVF